MVFAMLCGIAGLFWIVGLIPAVTRCGGAGFFLSGATAICRFCREFQVSIHSRSDGKIPLRVAEAMPSWDIVVLAIVAAGALAGLVCSSGCFTGCSAIQGNLTITDALTGFYDRLSAARVAMEDVKTADSQLNLVGVFSVNILPSNTPIRFGRCFDESGFSGDRLGCCPLEREKNSLPKRLSELSVNSRWEKLSQLSLSR